MPHLEVDERTALDLAAFIDASPSPYHACATAIARLEGAGFLPVQESGPWSDLPRRGYVQRGGSVFAWVLPESAPVHAGFRVLGAHTDSPNLRVKPRPDAGGGGFRQVGVEVYGGVLLNSWLDRDLGLSGRAYVEIGGALEERLFLVDRPVLRVPQLAIHLHREIYESGLKLDKQRHMAPVMAVGPQDHLAHTVLQGLTQVIAQRHRPEAKGRMPRQPAPWVGGAGQRQRMRHPFGSKQQARHQIAGKERCVGSSGHDCLGPLFCRPVEPGQDTREGPGKAVDAVGHNRQPQIGKARRIAIGVQRQPRHMRGEPIHHMRQQAVPAQAQAPLVAAAHPGRLPARQYNTQRLCHGLRCVGLYGVGIRAAMPTTA